MKFIGFCKKVSDSGRISLKHPNPIKPVQSWSSQAGPILVWFKLNPDPIKPKLTCLIISSGGGHSGFVSSPNQAVFEAADS